MALPEFDEYIRLIKSIGEADGMQLDPLMFWAEQCGRFRILARLAASILAIPATSSDVERLFSITGRIASTARASVSAERINTLMCLHSWLKAEQRDNAPPNDNNREAKKARQSQRFAYLSIGLEVIPGNEDEDDNAGDDEDDNV